MSKAPKIAIDARMINRSGIGTCIQHWIRQVPYDIALGDEKDLEPYQKFFGKFIPFVSGIYGYKEQLKFPYRKLLKAKPDVLHVPHCNVPLFYRGKMLVTVHDLTHIVYPQFLPMKLAGLYFKFIFRFVSWRADRILTDSENTRHDLLKFFGTNPAKIEVVPLGVGNEFVEKPKAELEYLYQKFGIPRDKKLILYVGNLLPHKNLSNLLKGFGKMPERENSRLILVGKAFENRTENPLKDSPEIAPLVIRAGVVSQEDLVGLYNLADLFALPSLYEGFGLPVLEAFACGTPVACSKTSSLPEVGGTVATYFDPESPKDIARALSLGIVQKGTNEKEMRAWVSKFTWENSSRRIREIAEDLCRE